MAADLWSEAVALARIEGAYPVARELRINFEGLKRRIAEHSSGATATSANAFVELTGAQLLGASSRAGTIVELSDEVGMRMTVRLAAETEVDVGRLIAAFRQRGG